MPSLNWATNTKGKGKGKSFDGWCYNCDKQGHMARDCRNGKGEVNSAEQPESEGGLDPGGGGETEPAKRRGAITWIGTAR